MKMFLAAAAALACAFGAASAQQQAVSNPHGMMSNFDINGVGAILTEMGAVWERRQAPNGQPYIVASVGGELVIQMFPTACQAQNFANCIGLHTYAVYTGSGLNYQTITAFNQKHPFATAGAIEGGSSAFLGRYDIADYGVPRGNVASSILNFVALAIRFRGELESANRTVSLEGYADDMSSRLLNTRGLAEIAGPNALEPLTRHDVAFEESIELIEMLLADQDEPRNKIQNIRAKP